MNANRLKHMLRFVGGRPTLILRDHSEGRIKVYVKGEWLFTVIPSHIMGCDCDAVLLGKAQQDGIEERTTWGGVAHALSEFQQTGNVPCMDAEGFEFE